MRILALETVNFRNLRNGHGYRFDVSPLTIIHGPNEAGKSSILEAIEVALFRRADKKSDLDFMTRGATVRPVVKLTVEHDEKQMTIERNYQDGRSYLKGGVLDIRDEKQIGRIIHEMLGFDDPNTFQELLIVRQNEMMGLDAQGIQKEIDTLVAGGSGGMTTTEILAELNSRLSSKRTGFKAADGKKYECLDGELAALDRKKQELGEKLDAVQATREDLEKNRVELNELESRKAAAEKSRTWLEAYVSLRSASDIKRQVEKIGAQLEILIPLLEKERSDIKSMEDRLADLRAVRGLEGQQELRKEKLKNALNELNGLREKKQQFAGIETALAGKSVPPKEDLVTFRSLVAKVGQLEETLRAQEVIVRIRARQDLETESGGTADRIAAGQEKEYPFRAYEGNLKVQGVADMAIINKGLKQSSDDIELCRTRMTKLVEQYGTESVPELEERFKKQEEKTRIEREYEKIGGDEKITELLKEVAGLEAEKARTDADIAALREKIGDTIALEIEEGILKRLKDQTADHEKTERDLDNQKVSLLGQKKREDIEREIERGQFTLAGLAATIPKAEQDVYMGLPTDELRQQVIGLSEQLMRYSERHTVCDREVIRLTAELKSAPAYENLVEIEEKIGTIKPAKEKADMYLKAFIALEEALREAQSRTRDIVSTIINDAAGRYFRAITQGKYDRVGVRLGDAIEVRVKEAGKPDLIPIDSGRPISVGALQQLYFAIRVALVEALTGGKKPPLLFDDPFVDFDAGRRKEAVRTLVKISASGHQCIHFTCHDIIAADGTGNQEVVTV